VDSSTHLLANERSLLGASLGGHRQQTAPVLAEPGRPERSGETTTDNYLRITCAAFEGGGGPRARRALALGHLHQGM